MPKKSIHEALSYLEKSQPELKKTLSEGLLKWAKQVPNVPAYTTKTEV